MQNIQVIKISLHQSERFFYSVEIQWGLVAMKKQ